ncbi:MAG TPA: replicative DNA helicase [Candidatus Faecenecus gallistercoris]|uniref:Replicative DNA helicase n=1 Tax=Candidatus Faecenecus gallistercoris TaxID=2840793 RepID=A0A9D1CKE8_9FIRM|nr:replicative DNA helicase [Bacillota bacterium]MDD7102419.1 replicative DNA helicase [Bacillota bacterium]MDY4051620.1 replicative DNA helicase [Candidatus Faecenecus gallistercoris]PWL72652.1 MAG: replicative DNA helicase [Bacillota bacterium]HIQ64413.1 replicative DNA helicase [Candidatus Faecenecus gallistercoris]
MAVKTLPNDIEAEQSVLGSMFLSKYALQQACETLTPDSFYLASNAKIFSCIQSLAEKDVPIDLTTVTAALKNSKLLSEVGGVEYLSEILNIVPTAANIDSYIKIVEDDAIRRKLIETATNICSMGYESDRSVSETLDQAEQKILTVVKNRRTSEFKSIQNVLFKAQEDLERLAETKNDITGIPTGWIDIDRATTGLHENELIIIAARPAMGKTAFALNLATSVAINTGKTVAVFNLEMSAEQLATRMLSSLGQVELNKLRTGNLLNDDWKRVNEAISQLSGAKMYIDDTPGINIGEIRSKCRRLASSDDGLGLVIIDYLQLISGVGNYGGNRQQEVSDISRALKVMAMELQIPVVALSQLSRSVETREDKRPIMSDLRESGSIEQDADIVSFLYRDDYYNKESKTSDSTSISEFIIGKNRSGSTTTIDLLFKRDMATFLSFRKDPESKGDKHE